MILSTPSAIISALSAATESRSGLGHFVDRERGGASILGNHATDPKAFLFDASYLVTDAFPVTCRSN